MTHSPKYLNLLIAYDRFLLRNSLNALTTNGNNVGDLTENDGMRTTNFTSIIGAVLLGNI